MLFDILSFLNTYFFSKTTINYFKYLFRFFSARCILINNLYYSVSNRLDVVAFIDSGVLFENSLLIISFSCDPSTPLGREYRLIGWWPFGVIGCRFHFGTEARWSERGSRGPLIFTVHWEATGLDVSATGQSSEFSLIGFMGLSAGSY